MGEKEMTTKEIATFFNVTESTIQKKAKFLGIKLIKGHSKEWSKEECDLLSKEIHKSETDSVMILRESNNELKMMFFEFMKQQSETNKILLSLIQNNPQKQIENHESKKIEYFSILGYARHEKISITKSERNHWSKIAQKTSEELNIKYYQEDDSIFGMVWIYNIEVLKKVFELREKEIISLFD
jgi:hypothetical protein